MESGEAAWQQGGAPSIGEEAEVADTDEALGEQVKQEATQKFIARDSHQLLPIVVGKDCRHHPRGSVRRASGFVLTGKPYLTDLGKVCRRAGSDHTVIRIEMPSAANFTSVARERCPFPWVLNCGHGARDSG